MGDRGFRLAELAEVLNLSVARCEQWLAKGHLDPGLPPIRPGQTRYWTVEAATRLQVMSFLVTLGVTPERAGSAVSRAEIPAGDTLIALVGACDPDAYPRAIWKPTLALSMREIEEIARTGVPVLAWSIDAVHRDVAARLAALDGERG